MLVKISIFNLIGVIFAKASNYLVIILLARIIGVDEFGKFGLIQSALATFAILLGGDIAMSSTKLVSEYCKTNVNNAKLVHKLSNLLLLIFILLFGIIVFLIKGELSFYILKSYDYDIVLLLAITSMIIMTFNLINSGVLAGYNEFKCIFYSNLFRGGIGILILVPLIYKIELKGYYLGLNIVLLIENRIINYFHYRVISSIEKTSTVSLNKQLLFAFFKKFTLPAMVSASLYAPSLFIFNYIISSTSEGFTQLGVFNAINQLSIMTMVITIAVSQPLLSRMLNTNSGGNIHINKLNMSIGVFVGLIFSIPLLMFPEIIGMIFGLSYTKLDLTFPILLMVLTTNVILFKQGILRLIISRGNMRDSVISNLIWSILLITSIMLFNERGLNGISFAFFIAYFINTILIVPYYLKIKLIEANMLKQKIIYMAIPILVLSFYLGDSNQSFSLRLFSAFFLLCVLSCVYLYENRILLKAN